EVRINLLRDRLAAAAEVQHGGRRDRHLRGDMRLVCMLLQEPEMIQHRMGVGKIELADDADGVMAGLDARELNAGVGMEKFAAAELGQKIEMPPGAAKLAVGREFQTEG